MSITNGEYFVNQFEYFDPKEKKERPWKYGVMPIEGGVEPEDLGFFSFRTVRWKPDGSGIYFLDPAKSVNNVWLYSFATKTSRKISNFDSLKIANMRVSPDGKQIAVSRGSYNSEIIKITGF